MKSRFELDQVGEPGPDAPYVDLEPCDRSEKDFAVSLSAGANAGPRFTVEEASINPAVFSPREQFLGFPEAPDAPREGQKPAASETGEDIRHFIDSRSIDSQGDGNSENTWRQEVSARLSKYQARKRPREPRYPSLQLKFEPQETWPSASVEFESIHYAQLNPTALARAAEVVGPSLPESLPRRESVPQLEPRARILEFPRSLITPEVLSDELAEAVFERPRIMEAPEIVPLAPAQDGILIENIEATANEKRPGFEMPLQAAGTSRRLAATLIDALIVMIALAIFAAIFWRINALIPPVRLSAAIAAIVGAVFWAGYQYLLIVHSGTTPGLKLAKLQLNHFNGAPVPRKKRRWRVLASALSGISLGLGYAWSYLDEDRLCWHDRIMRTYIGPKD